MPVTVRPIEATDHDEWVALFTAYEKGVYAAMA